MFRQRRQTGSITAKPRSGWQRGRVTAPPMRQMVVELYEQKNDWTLAEVAAHLEAAFAVRLSAPTVCQIVRRENLRFKKG